VRAQTDDKKKKTFFKSQLQHLTNYRYFVSQKTGGTFTLIITKQKIYALKIKREKRKLFLQTNNNLIILSRFY